MNVGELIEELKKYPPEMKIEVITEPSYYGSYKGELTKDEIEIIEDETENLLFIGGR